MNNLIHNETKDRKQNWILIRGWGRDSRHWGEFIELFTKSFDNYSIHLIDLPGSGQLSSQTSPKSIAGIADRVAMLWKEKHQDESAHVIALSLGAMVTIEWINRYPEMIDSAVLMNPSSHSLSPFYQRLYYRIYPDILLMLFSSIKTRERKIVELTSNLYPHRKKLGQLWLDYARENSISYGNMFRQLWAASQYHLPTTKPEKPIMILNSLSDRLVHPICSKVIAEHWNLPLHRHPAAGHDLTLDAPLWVIEQLKEGYN